jgi:hypothetical protein
VLGSAAPEGAVTWLQRLMDLPNSRFALQFGDADVAVQLEAGLNRPLRPTSLTAYMDPADFVPDPEAEPTPAPTATPAPDPDVVVLPGMDELLDIGGARSAVYWPAGGTATSDVVSEIGGITVDDQTSLTLLSSAATAGGAVGETVPARARVDEADVLVYDADASAALRDASLEDTARRGAPLTAAAAYLAFATDESGGGPLLVTVDRAQGRSNVALGATIGAALRTPGAVPITLSGLSAADASPITLTDAAVPSERVAAASALFADEAELSRFATILDEPSLLTGPERAEILQLLGAGWTGDDLAWNAAVATHRQATAATLDAVGLLPTDSIDLYGSNAGLRFWVRNDLPYPVNLVLYATPDDLRLDVQGENPVVATASSNTRVEVPVQARLGNGEVTIALQLRSPASVAIGDPMSVDVNVRAEWETFGVAALGTVVGALLLLGVVRTVLRMRARRKAAETDAADDA